MRRLGHAGLLLATALVAFGGCTSRPQVELDQSPGATGSLPPGFDPTDGSTGPGSVTPTAPQTVTVTVMPTGTALPMNPSLPAVFDESAARQATQAVLRDIGGLDRAFVTAAGTNPRTRPPTPGASGGASSTRPTASDPRAAARDLTALDSHLGGLLAAGVPPGTDGPSYVARILSLRVFVSAAVGETSTDPARAAARYQVIRGEVGVLLTQVSTGTGATLTLPPSRPAR
ncbi:MAG: hypothetical protein L0H79_15930 [Intrasporangium sp.]|uniref:hypothetical protein n=1 Tax=Intrasporangium sp. TaxID=1925024 RepID=UPI0026487B37|nr:hypothetical protein [Intrasporangium sp.]MDN5797226.1 hypothetical protein [Intrasporangium sp.]